MQGRRLPRVATIATMPSRLETFSKVFPAVHAQVDHMYVYLDGFEEVPEFLQQADRVSVYRAEQVGDLHASSRYLCVRELGEPSIVISVDDDIIYPPDYVEQLVAALDQVNGRAVVGVHGRVFLPPHRSYARDVWCSAFFSKSAEMRHMHELGAGTCCFRSDVLDIDPRIWKRYNMEDIYLAIEAQRRGLPRLSIPRALNWLRPYAENQPDSLWLKAQKDDSEQTKLMRVLLSLYTGIGRAPAGSGNQAAATPSTAA